MYGTINNGNFVKILWQIALACDLTVHTSMHLREA
jgi:hypothetical protein